jgi:hypothetical protein
VSREWVVKRRFTTSCSRALARASTLLVLTGSLPVRADPFHFQGIPLGQRAIGFGGAFTAVADDPSASFYNPAGLVTTGDSALSASLTLNAFDRQTIVDGFRTPLGDTDLKHESEPSLPVSGGFLKRLGKRDADGERVHAIGLSTYAFDQRNLTFDVEIMDPGRTGIATLSVDRSNRTTWNGLSYAYRVSDRLSFGLSGFLSITRTHYREEQVGAALGAIDPEDGSYTSDSGAWASHRVSTNVKNLALRLGALYKLNPQLRLGVMFQPPSLHVRGQSSVRQRVLDTGPGAAEGSFLDVREDGLPSRAPLPWELRLGSAYKPRDWLTLTFDASVYGGPETRNSVTAVGPRSADPETGAIADLGYFEQETWKRKVSGNVSIGTQAVAWDVIAIRAGFFTSLSAAPSVPRESSVYYAPDINRYGGALSVGLNAGGYDLSLGSAGLFGRGDALAFDTRPDASALYQRTEVKDATLFIFLTGIRNAVQKLAKSADQKLQELKRARAQDAEPAAAEPPAGAGPPAAEPAGAQPSSEPP